MRGWVRVKQFFQLQQHGFSWICGGKPHLKIGVLGTVNWGLGIANSFGSKGLDKIISFTYHRKDRRSEKRLMLLDHTGK